MNVVSFYRFVDVAEPASLRDELEALCLQQNLLGTILVAGEGFNGTLAGNADGVRAVFGFLRNKFGLTEPIDARWTEATEAPFKRLRIRHKKEIVTLGRDGIAPHKSTGKHVMADEWNRLIADPDTLVIDTRNQYEIELGSFPGAVDPGTDSFRDFPDYAEKLAAEGTDRPLAMFCTGGIRCEKATALMQQLGFDEVYQLQGGILNYLEQVSDDENQWQGNCFVFDSRVAVDRDRAEGGYVQCHACRRPLTSDDLASADYKPGIACPHCA